MASLYWDSLWCVLFVSFPMSRVFCWKGPTRHAYTWQIGPFWQDTLDVFENFGCRRLWSIISEVITPPFIVHMVVLQCWCCLSSIRWQSCSLPLDPQWQHPFVSTPWHMSAATPLCGCWLVGTNCLHEYKCKFFIAHMYDKKSSWLIHWGLHKMADILLRTFVFVNKYSWRKISKIWLKFH